MPSTSGPSETSGGTDVETTGAEDGPRLRVTASMGSASGRRPVYHHRVRVAALTAEREALDEQVDALRAEMEALEAEVEALERTVESKERQRQQVIDNYETIVENRTEADCEPESEPGAAESTERGPLAAVASRIERVMARLRRSDE